MPIALAARRKPVDWSRVPKVLRPLQKVAELPQKIEQTAEATGWFTDQLLGEQGLAVTNPALFRYLKARERMTGQDTPSEEYFSGIRRGRPAGKVSQVASELTRGLAVPISSASAGLGGLLGSVVPGAGTALGAGAGRVAGLATTRGLANLLNPSAADRNPIVDVAEASAGVLIGRAFGAALGRWRAAQAARRLARSPETQRAISEVTPSVATEVPPTTGRFVSEIPPPTEPYPTPAGRGPGRWPGKRPTAPFSVGFRGRVGALQRPSPPGPAPVPTEEFGPSVMPPAPTPYGARTLGQIARQGRVSLRGAPRVERPKTDLGALTQEAEDAAYASQIAAQEAGMGEAMSIEQLGKMLRGEARAKVKGKIGRQPTRMSRQQSQALSDLRLTTGMYIPPVKVPTGTPQIHRMEQLKAGAAAAFDYLPYSNFRKLISGIHVYEFPGEVLGKARFHGRSGLGDYVILSRGAWQDLPHELGHGFAKKLLPEERQALLRQINSQMLRRGKQAVLPGMEEAHRPTTHPTSSGYYAKTEESLAELIDKAITGKGRRETWSPEARKILEKIEQEVRKQLGPQADRRSVRQLSLLVIAGGLSTQRKSRARS